MRMPLPFEQTARTSADRAIHRVAKAWGIALVLLASESGAWAAETQRILPKEWNYLDVGKLPVLITLLLFGAFYLYLYRETKVGRPMRLRRLPGIDAIEEAIARATEMGRPVLFIPGINDIDDIQTLAGINILSHVAYIAAEYDTPLIVACRRSVVLTISEEVVKAASLAAGRPENYIPNNMRYLSDDQFAFTAGVNGIMLRERPASCIYQGCFYSESLTLAETGSMSGAIQVAGTANVAQLPFFVAACDFTLIGEEFFAASAYLSRDPSVVASIEAADRLKMVYLIVILVGVALATAVNLFPSPTLMTYLQLLKEIF
ncbi:MAG: hypothetical protein N2Z21_05195 [Candidatus Sumerlaeaceae bacterium]|nr:hypothetical protein [Candidatus Sumerlaeaceae bacterium]